MNCSSSDRCATFLFFLQVPTIDHTREGRIKMYKTSRFTSLERVETILYNCGVFFTNRSCPTSVSIRPSQQPDSSQPIQPTARTKTPSPIPTFIETGDRKKKKASLSKSRTTEQPTQVQHCTTGYSSSPYSGTLSIRIPIPISNPPTPGGKRGGRGGEGGRE